MRHHGHVLVRIGMVVVALAAIVVMAIWWNDARLLGDARHAAVTARTPADVERAARLFERSRRLSPDTLPQTGEAFMLLRAGQLDRGVRLLDDIVRREPRNATAWGLIAIAEQKRDPARAALARAKEAALNPPVSAH
jgi:predicted Zn-dependent protease